jgi:putative addiction module component (TIGR02574 family)
MTRPLATLEEELRSLSDSDKETLLRVLLEELDGPPDADVEAAWLDEVQRRSDEIDAGVVQTVPAEEVFARIRSRFSR